MSHREHRISVPVMERVIDDGPYAGQLSGNSVVIWKEKRAPNILDIIMAEQNTPPEMAIEDVFGARRQFGLKETLLITRGEVMQIQRRRRLKLGWKTLEIIELHNSIG